MDSPVLMIYFSICLLLLNCVLLTSADPVIVSQPDTVEVYSGGTAVLKCQVANLSNSVVSWTFISKDITIFQGNQRFTDDPIKYSLIGTPDQQMHDLQIMGVEHIDQGYYKCSIDGTDQYIISKLDVIDMPDGPVGEAPSINVTDCCIAEGVLPECLPACYPDQIDLDIFDARISCDASVSLTGLAKCFSNGRNHDTCCLASGVDPLCLGFCHNEVPDSLTAEHAVKCYSGGAINAMFDCFKVGFEFLPSAPREFSALSFNNGKASVLLSWKEPGDNPHTVTGYKIMYKEVGETTYKSVLIKDSSINQYTLAEGTAEVEPNKGFAIHIAALADHGVSFGSSEITIFLPDTSVQANLAKSIDACCQNREVSDNCRNLLCKSKTWSNFQSSDVLQCWSYLDHIFTCLADERDHSSCCQSYDVTTDCQPLCSGNPPPFNGSLIGCVSQMGVIEACIQNGYDTLPAPPTKLRVVTVMSKTAMLAFEPSSSPGIVKYVWQWKLKESDSFEDYKTTNPTGSVINLNDLQPNTYYWIRVIAESADKGSLPSNAVEFLTYPGDFFNPTPPPVINIPHNLTECCKESGMPEVCWKGCIYSPNMTAYYGMHLTVCANFIGSVLSCAADGRDHTQCCENRGMSDLCQNLCRITSSGPLASELTRCVGETSSAVLCFIEGIVDLPRHPDVFVTNVTMSTISLDWEQPQTGGKIETYHITYGEPDKGSTKNVSTPHTGYILQDLKPGTKYTISVSSENENGTSVNSPEITVFTLEMEDTTPDYNLTVETGRAYWENITHCCENSVSAPCQAQCLNKQSSATYNCASESHKILACFADGQDHRVCCERNNLPAACLPLCGGKALESSISAATCMSYAHNDIILSCFLERQGLIPLAPPDFIAKLNSGAKIELSWSVPDYCNEVCTYSVHYWKKGDESNPKTLSDVKSPFVVPGLALNNFYTFTVSAENTYGSGPPSPWQTILFEYFAKAVKVTLVSDVEWVNTGEPAFLRCAMSEFNPADPTRIEWHLNGRKLDSTGRTLSIAAVDPSKDEGFYTCSVIDSVSNNSATLYLPIKYAPTFDQVKIDKVRPTGDKQGKIACWFKGYPTSDRENWYKDNVKISRDITKYSMQLDTRYDTGITSYRIKIAYVVEEDYGNYHIEVSNEFGTAKCLVAFQNPDDETVVAPAPKETDPMQCCRNANVSNLCLELCSFDVNLAVIASDLQYISCLGYVETLIQCGADGRDHSKCCYSSGVNPLCVPLCNGVVPNEDPSELIDCILDTPTIFNCAQKGHNNIPFRPHNVNLSSRDNDRSFLVSWSQPQYLHDKVDHYSIYYNYTGHPQPLSIHVNHLILEYTITDVVPRSTYNVWVVAGNKNGNSQPSEIATFVVSDFPTNLSAAVVENSADVDLTWQMDAGSMYSSYLVYYKKLNDARFTMIPVVSAKNYRLTGLDPNTQYIWYVKGVSGADISAESDRVTFTTGGTAEPARTEIPGGEKGEQSGSDDDDDKKVAIGVGVTVAIIALIAIVFLVLFFVYRSRTAKANLNDTVAFENPAFGSAQVKMHAVDDSYDYGRLQEDSVPNNTNNPYDNPGFNGDAMTSQTQQPDNPNSAATLQV